MWQMAVEHKLASRDIWWLRGESHIKRFYIRIKTVTSVLPHTSVFIILGFREYLKWTLGNKSLYYDC